MLAKEIGKNKIQSRLQAFPIFLDSNNRFLENKKISVIPWIGRTVQETLDIKLTVFLVVDHWSVCHPSVTTQNFMESSHSVLVVPFQEIQVSIQMLLDSEAGWKLLLKVPQLLMSLTVSTI